MAHIKIRMVWSEAENGFSVVFRLPTKYASANNTGTAQA
jgi:hypothetical protein